MAKNTGNLSSASMIDLKAELFRKQEEYKKKKVELQSTNEGYVRGKVEDSGIKKKSNIWSKKNKGVLERAQRDFEQKVEEDDVNEKSRKALEAKARLYDKITNSSEIPDEDGSGIYLVDFQRKVIDSIDEKIEKDREKEKCSQDEEIPPPSTSDEEWVDYVDTLGRSRRCLRKDLPALIEQDKKFSKQPGSQNVENEGQSDNLPTLLSNDMKREIERQKWEKEEFERIKEGPVHYSNVLHNEIRTHGVGFYQFSKDDEERQEQMETLTQIRDETVTARSRIEKLKEKRKAQLVARLEKVKQRRRMKEGYVETEGESKESEVKKEDDDKTESELKKEDEIGPKLEEMLTQQRSIVEAETKKDKPLREWDKGKEKLFAWSEEKYFQDRRDERELEFAPPSMYKDAPKHMGKKVKKIKRDYIEAEQTCQENTTEEKKTTGKNIDDLLSEQRLLASQTQHNTGNSSTTDPKFDPNYGYSGDLSAGRDYQQQLQSYPNAQGIEFRQNLEQGYSGFENQNSSGFINNIPSVQYPTLVNMVTQPSVSENFPIFSVPPPGYNPIPVPTQQPIYPPPSHYPQNYTPQPPKSVNTDYSQYFSNQGQGATSQNVGLNPNTGGSSVSKLDIVDTRLVKKDDGLDDLEESGNVQALSSQSVPYKPGTFYLASLKKQQGTAYQDYPVVSQPGPVSVSEQQPQNSDPMSFSGDAITYKPPS